MMIEELYERRNRLQGEVESLEESRIRIEEEIARLCERRRRLLNRIRELRSEISNSRKERDRYNQETGENKKMRDECNARLREIYEEIKRLNGIGDFNIEEIRREIDRLEFIQQTTALSPDRERRLVERISLLRRKLEHAEEEIRRRSELSELWSKFSELKTMAEQYHKKVLQSARLAQEFHRRLLNSQRELEETKREMENVNNEIKMLMDKSKQLRRSIVRAQRELREFNEVLNALERIPKHENVYEKLKAGEKITTEDILAMQRSEFRQHPP